MNFDSFIDMKHIRDKCVSNGRTCPATKTTKSFEKFLTPRTGVLLQPPADIIGPNLCFKQYRFISQLFHKLVAESKIS